MRRNFWAVRALRITMPMPARRARSIRLKRVPLVSTLITHPIRLPVGFPSALRTLNFLFFQFVFHSNYSLNTSLYDAGLTLSHSCISLLCLGENTFLIKSLQQLAYIFAKFSTKIGIGKNNQNFLSKKFGDIKDNFVICRKIRDLYA